MLPRKAPLDKITNQKTGGQTSLSQHKSRMVQITFLILLTALPYLNSLRNDFVYDDSVQVVDNPYIRDFHHVKSIFTTTVWSYLPGFQGTSNYYRPLMTLGYALCYRLSGLHPFGFHLANLLLHVGVVLLLFGLTKKMFGSHSLALVAAALFAVHPIHTEDVDWIAAVTELELAFFFLLTFWFFLSASAHDRWRRSAAQAGMAASFALALLSKEQALVLPVLASIYEHFYRPGRPATTWNQKFSRYALLWLIVPTYFFVRIALLKGFAPVVSRPELGPVEVGLSAMALVGQYFWKLLWPASLSAFYVFPRDVFALASWMIIGLMVLILCAFLIPLLRTRAPAISFGLVWILITLGPVLNARWMADSVFGERYLYLPSVGFCWIAAWAGVKLWETPWRHRMLSKAALGAVAVSMLALCVIRIVTRNRDWKDNLIFYKQTLAASPDAYLIHNNLGALYWKRGDIQDAEQQWRETLNLAPNYPYALHNLGLVMRREKRFDAAVSFFRRAIEITPNYAESHLDLALTYEKMGQRPKAESELQAAVALAPLNVQMRNALGELYLDEKRLDEAQTQFQRSLTIAPTLRAYWGLGFAHWEKKDFAGAEQAFRSAETLNPSSARAHFILGLFYVDVGQTSNAIGEYKAGLRTDPTNAEALEALRKLTSHITRADKPKS